MEESSKKSAYMICYIITLVFFGIANIADQLAGHSDYSGSYPFFLFLIWTGIVATFLYMGWKWMFYINAVPLYVVTVYTVWNHAPKDEPTALDWLIGSLPVPIEYLMFVPGLILLSILLQLILNHRMVKKTTYVYEEPDDAEEEEFEYDETDERG